MGIPNRDERAAWVEGHPMRAITACVLGAAGLLLNCLAAYYQDVMALALGAAMIGLALLVGWRFWLGRVF